MTSQTKLPTVQLSSKELKERMIKLSESSKEKPVGFLKNLQYIFCQTEHSPTQFLLMKQKINDINLTLKDKRKEVKARTNACDQKWLVLKEKEKEVIKHNYFDYKFTLSG